MKKFTVFACCFDCQFSADKPWRRYKVTIDPIHRTSSFYPFRGSEHAVCNHDPQVLTPEQLNLFQDIAFMQLPDRMSD